MYIDCAINKLYSFRTPVIPKFVANETTFKNV